MRTIEADLGGTYQNLGIGVFRVDGSAEGYYVYLHVSPGNLKLNPTNLRWEATGTLFVAEAKTGGVVLVRNEAQVSVAVVPTGRPAPYDMAAVDIRATGNAVDGNAFRLFSTGGPEVQGEIGGIPILVNHCRIEVD